MISILAVNTLAIFFAYLAKNKNMQFMFGLSLIVLCGFYGIRYDFGNDYWSYYDLYLESAYGVDAGVVEPGWGLINYLCQPIGFFGMIFILTVFEYYSVFKHIRLYVGKEYWWLAVFIFCFTFNFLLLGCSMMRQFLSMVILLYSIKYISERRIIPFLIIVGIAMSIHKTAIIFVPIYLLSLWKPNISKKRWILSSVIGFICLMILSKTYLELFQLAAILFNDEKFSRYLLGDEGSYSFTIIFDILWLVLLMYYCPQEKIGKIICLISILSYVFLPFAFVVVMLLRLMLFFSFFFIFTIPTMIQKIELKPVRYVILFIYMFLLLRRSIVSYNGETYGGYFEYKTIFESLNWL